MRLNCHTTNRLQIALDVETTGLSPLRGERVIEIGAVAIYDRRVIAEFQSLINTEKRVSSSARRVHGISDEMRTGQPKPDEVFSSFRDFIGEGVLVAHNAPFDQGFLRHEFARLGMELINPFFCTLELSRERFPRLRDHKLQTVYRHLCREPERAIQPHRALDDARMVAQIWVELIKG